MSFKSCFGTLEDTGNSLMRFGILIEIWSLVFDTPILQILALYLDFEGAENIYVHLVIIWGFGGCWRFLTGVWHLDLDLDMVMGPGFGLCSWFLLWLLSLALFLLSRVKKICCLRWVRVRDRVRVGRFGWRGCWSWLCLRISQN